MKQKHVRLFVCLAGWALSFVLSYAFWRVHGSDSLPADRAIASDRVIASEDEVPALLRSAKAEVHNGNHVAAQKYMQAVLEKEQAVYGTDAIQLIPDLQLLATIQADQSHFKEAKESYIKAITIAENKIGDRSLVVCKILSSFASVYQLEGNYGEAQNLYTKALLLAKANGARLEEAIILNNQGTAFLEAESFDEAENAFLKSLAIKKQILGPRDPACAPSLANLSDVYCAQKKFAKAKKLLLESMELRRSALGDDNPELAVGLANLGSICAEQGDLDEAEKLFKKSVELREKRDGLDNLSLTPVLDNLADLYATQGKFQPAIKAARRSLEILTRNFGKDNPDVAAAKVRCQEIENQFLSTNKPVD